MMLDEVGTFLQSAGLSLTLGTNLFLSLLPETPNDCTAIYEVAGIPPAIVMSTDLPGIDQPRLQVVTRSTSYSTARTKADTIWKALLGVRDETLSGVYYLAINALDSPSPTARDHVQRERIMANFQVWKAPS